MTDPQPEETPAADDGPTRVRIRRAPKLRVFVVLGALVGFLVTLFATGAFPADPHVGFVALLAYFSLYGVTAGVLLGAIVGIIADRMSTRRQHTVLVERERVQSAADDHPYDRGDRPLDQSDDGPPE